MFESVIRQINNDFKIVKSNKPSDIRNNIFREVLLAIVSHYVIEREKKELNITEILNVVKVFKGDVDYPMIFDVFTYLSSKKVRFISLNFVYFLKDDSRHPISALQYFKIKSEQDLNVLNESDFKVIGYEPNINRFGFYGTINERNKEFNLWS